MTSTVSDAEASETHTNEKSVGQKWSADAINAVNFRYFKRRTWYEVKF